MVNLVKKQYDKVTGLVVGLHLIGENTFGNQINERYALAQLSISELVDGKATLILPLAEDYGNFPFSPAPHTDDPVGEVGSVNYTLIKNLIDPITLGHGEPAPPREPTQVEKDINTAFVAIGNIFPRLVKLEKAFVPPIIFDGWVAEGRELRLYRGGTGGDVCIIGVHNGFGGLCPRHIEGQPPDSLERMLDIEVNGSVHQLHIFSYGDTGRIATAIAQNLPTQTLGTPRPESGAESG